MKNMLKCCLLIFKLDALRFNITVFILHIRTDRFEQTVWTQIKRRRAASDLGPHCLLLNLQVLDNHQAVKWNWPFKDKFGKELKCPNIHGLYGNHSTLPTPNEPSPYVFPEKKLGKSWEPKTFDWAVVQSFRKIRTLFENITLFNTLHAG